MAALSFSSPYSRLIIETLLPTGIAATITITPKKTGFENDTRIKFVGTVYDQELLKKIREEAFAYIHGHEVGGTNPSLLEALASTRLNLLYDVGFNFEVGKTSVVYWDKNEETLNNRLKEVERLSYDTINVMADSAKLRIRENYQWNGIIEKYEELFITS